MPVVLRTRRSSVVAILIVAAACVPLVAADGPPPPLWVIPIVLVAVLLAVARTRVEIGPMRVRIVGLGPATEVDRQRLVAVHASGGRNRPAFVAVDDGTRIRVPVLLASERVASALGVPHLSWAGDRELTIRPSSRWIAAACVLAIVVLGTVVFLRQR